jgi:hypothetical protein
MPLHSSHLLQPLNVGCFAPLKKAYRRQAKGLIRNQITHITKTKFLPCFIGAYNAAITPSNIQGGFQGAGLVPFNPQRVIIGLNVKLRTLSPLLPSNNEPWQSQTPKNLVEFESQLTLIQDKYKRQQGSSPNSVYSALKHYAKGGAIVAHKLALALQEIAELQAANKAATRRKSHKRKQIQAEGTLIVKDSQRLIALKEFGARSNRKKAKKQVRARGSKLSQRRCGQCNKTRHNAQTYKQDIEVVSK